MSTKNIIYNMRPSYDGLSDLIKFIQNDHDTHNYSLIEIGAYAGQSTVFFAQHFQSVITIDPFINDYDGNDPTCQFMKLESVYETFQKNISQYNNITHLKLTSDDAVSRISSMVDKNNVLAVYIDGLHTFDQVHKDIINYMPFIYDDGYICGHDYNLTNWPQVCKAIDSTLGVPLKVFNDTSWIIKKKTNA